VKGAYIRILNSDNKTELVRYKLAEDFKGKKSIIVGELYKSKDEWKFRAVGEGSTEGDLTKVVRTYLS
jgi:stress response protein SCP2